MRGLNVLAADRIAAGPVEIAKLTLEFEINLFYLCSRSRALLRAKGGSVREHHHRLVLSVDELLRPATDDEVRNRGPQTQQPRRRRIGPNSIAIGASDAR